MSEEKKIIIDEDWKSQVQAEKEAAEKAAAEKEAPGEAMPPEQPVSESASTDDAALPEDPPMPPASIGMLMSSLATEALMAMGQIPHPATGETKPRRNQAKYLIDTLDVLKEKTAGNLAPEEAAALDDVLHQLRMAFVASK